MSNLKEIIENINKIRYIEYDIIKKDYKIVFRVNKLNLINDPSFLMVYNSFFFKESVLLISWKEIIKN